MKQIGIILLALVVVVMAQPHEGCRGKQGGSGQVKGEHHQKMVAELRLTEQQQSQMEALRQGKKEVYKAEKEKNKAHRTELDALLRAPQVNQRAINKKLAEISAIKAAKMNEHVSHLLEIKKILTPEQFDKFLDMKKTRMGKHGQGHGQEKGSCQDGGKAQGHGHHK